MKHFCRYATSWMLSTRNAVATPSFMLLFLVSTTYLLSQENRGSILGLVTDQSSASVVGATVRATNADTGVMTSVQTNSTGNYNIPFLPPGTYRIEVEAQGFAKVGSTANLNVGESVRVNISLQIGSSQQSVTVSAQSPLLETASTTTGQTIGSEVINQLPMAGRNLVSLGLMGAGTTQSANGFSGAVSGGWTGGVAIIGNGLRDEDSQYTMDGANINVGMYNYPAYVPLPDEVQEMSTVTGNYSAEYGQFGGAHINFALKSGTNSFHGNAFEYLQNTALNARNYFSTTVPTLRDNHFGGVLGGPIIRNKTFFMGSYEGERTYTESLSENIVLTQAQRNGDLSQNADGSPAAPIINPATGQPFPNNQIPVSQQAAALLDLEPLPNLMGQGAVNNSTNYNLPSTINNFLIKIDHSLRPSDQLSGVYLKKHVTGTTLAGSTVGDANYLNHSAAVQSANLVEVHTFSPSAVLSTRGSWNSLHNNDTYQFYTDIDARTQYHMTIPGDIGPGNTFNLPPWIQISGYTNFSSPGNSPLFQPDSNYEIASALALTHGRHTLSFGAELDRYRSSRLVGNYTNGIIYFSPTNAAGTGNAVADFLLGLPSGGHFGSTPESVDLRRSSFDMYAADQWQLTPKMTINFGLRYELHVPVNEHNGQISLFSFTPPGAFRTLQPGQELWNPKLDNFAPRLGIAYRLTGKDVIRVSGGIYYSQESLLSVTYGATNPPFNPTFNFNSAADAPIYLSNPFPINEAAPSGLPSPFAYQQYPHTPQVYQWMLDVQHSFTPSLLLQIGYLGNRGVDFANGTEQNIPLTPGPGNIQARRPLPDFGAATYYVMNSFSTYNGLQVHGEKRFSHGLWFVANYTWSKNLDLSSNSLSFFGTGTVIPTDPNFYYGPSDFDRRQSLQVGYIYDLPFGKGRQFMNTNGVMNEVFGGWRLSGWTHVYSGQPFSATYPGDVANVGLGTIPVSTCSGHLAHPTIQEWFDVSCFQAPAQYTFGTVKKGTLIGPSYKQWDIGMGKNFSIFREHSLEFRAEFFNAFNNANFEPPNGGIDTPGVAQITSANAARTGQLGLNYHF
jgi:Carboxypeptidase regulatory-like domain